MVHGSCMIVVGRLGGKSPHSSSTAIAEVARDLPTIPQKVLPHTFIVGLFPVRVNSMHGGSVSSPQEPVAHSKNTRSVLFFSNDGTSPGATQFWNMLEDLKI